MLRHRQTGKRTFLRLLQARIFSNSINLKDSNLFRGGITKDARPWYFRLIAIESDKKIPDQNVTAVVGILYPLLFKDTIIAIENKRGIDIPGGHIEPGESYEQAIRRECMEEASADLKEVTPLALLESDKGLHKKTYIVVCKADCHLFPFKPTEEIAKRHLLPIDSFLNAYFGDKTLMRRLLQLASQK